MTYKIFKGKRHVLIQDICQEMYNYVTANKGAMIIFNGIKIVMRKANEFDEDELKEK